MTKTIVLTFPEGTSEAVASEVAEQIVAAVESDLQAIVNGGMTAEEAFGEGMVAPTSIALINE